MPTGLPPESFVSWPIICLEGNAAICPQRLPLARAIGEGFGQPSTQQKKCNQPYLEPV
jgi:hypothetical protein